MDITASAGIARLAGRLSLRFAASAALLVAACSGADEGVQALAPAPTSAAPAVISHSTDDLASLATSTATAIPLPTETPAPIPPPVPDASPTEPPAERAAEAIVAPDTLTTLSPGGRVRVAGSGWTVTFHEVVEDSRCPAGVQCIWAGQVVLRLIGEHTDGLVAALTLTMPAGAATSGVLGALTVEAVKIDPTPVAGVPRVPGDYVLAVRLGLAASPDRSGLSGVRGRVTIGPMCPVIREGQPCPDQPYSALLVVRGRDGREVSRVRSAADGTYALPLPPGEYVMTPQLSPSRMPSAASEKFFVAPSTWTSLDVAFDSGIR